MPEGGLRRKRADMPSLAILMPTRGLVFGETVRSLVENVKDFETEWKFAIGLPIPDCHNYVVEEALKTDCDYFLFVEEDMFLPEGAVKRMYGQGDIVALDYPVDSGHGTVQRKCGEVIFCGLGCTMIRREVFERMERPWFETDKSLRITSQDPFEYEVWDVPYKYGGQDMLFCHKARELGYKIQAIEGEAQHLRVRQLDDRKYNQGAQVIEALPPIAKHISYN